FIYHLLLLYTEPFRRQIHRFEQQAEASSRPVHSHTLPRCRSVHPLRRFLLSPARRIRRHSTLHLLSVFTRCDLWEVTRGNDCGWIGRRRERR
ncbi:hypothetical protein PFISCL1PPCAC_11074, partial [Pristionchus fissidentatus]